LAAGSVSATIGAAAIALPAIMAVLKKLIWAMNSRRLDMEYFLKLQIKNIRKLKPAETKLYCAADDFSWG
jgi:hypothetical protein